MHKKLYKAGKFWVATAVAIAGMTFSFCTASADSANVDSSSTTLSQSQNDNSAQSSSTQEGITSTNSTSTTNGENNGEQSNSQTGVTLSPRDAALAKYANEHVTGYIFSPDVSTANGGYNWFENGQLFSGFRYYMGTYYWFVDGVRQNEGWRQAWGLTYYTDADGRAVQGHHNIDGQDFYFGDDGSYYLRSTGYLYDGSSQNGGYRWYENGQLYTGFRYYMGTYYWFVDGVRQNEGWRQAWGMTYYTDADGRAVQGTRVIDGKVYDFGDDGTYYSRPVNGYVWDGSSQNGGYRWYDKGNLYTGFKYYMGTYYWFVDGVRQNEGWRYAWGMTYYTDVDGRAVQGTRVIDGKVYDFGNDGTYYSRPVNGYVWDGSSQNGGYRWYENGNLYTGFKYYMGTYYWFVDGVRQNAGWRQAWGMTYYTDDNGRAVQGRYWIDGGQYFFGTDGSYFLRTNKYVADNDGVYFAGGDGRFLTGTQGIYGRTVNFFSDGRLNTDGLNIDFPHWSLNQVSLGAPEGCEGVSFQMALSAKGKRVPSLQEIYNRIGYGDGVSPYEGFDGNPFGGARSYTETVLAAPLAAKLNNAFGVQTQDITGAGPNQILAQLLSWNPVISYIPWDFQVGAGRDHFHVQMIYGYRNGGFLVADPLQYARGANYWISTGEWWYLNSNVQPVGFGAPSSMNVAVI